MVHGEEGLAKAERITETFFHGDIMSLSAEEIREGLADAVKTPVEDGSSLIDGLLKAGICKSKGDARRLLQQGSVSVNGNKVTSLDAVLSRSEAVEGEFSIVKKGKKNYYLFTF